MLADICVIFIADLKSTMLADIILIFIADFKSTVLTEGLGAAFLLQPAFGMLQPFGEQMIEVTAYSDMWGKYSDNIICKVGCGRVLACALESTLPSLKSKGICIYIYV